MGIARGAIALPPLSIAKKYVNVEQKCKVPTLGCIHPPSPDDISNSALET